MFSVADISSKLIYGIILSRYVLRRSALEGYVPAAEALETSPLGATVASKRGGLGGLFRLANMRAEGLRLDAGALLAMAAVGAAMVAQVVGGAFSTAVALMLLAAGMLHGAGDEDEEGIRPFSLAHAAGYIAFAAAVASLYLVSPVSGLISFLAISGWHFATSRCGFGRSSQLAVGGCTIGGGALFHGAQTAQVFGSITGEPILGLLMAVLALAGLVGVACAGYALLRMARGASYAVTAALAVLLADPILAVALIFFVAHALPTHRQQITDHGLEDVLRATLPTGLLALTGSLILVVLAAAGLVTLPVAAAIAFGLATPHMLTTASSRLPDRAAIRSARAFSAVDGERSDRREN